MSNDEHESIWHDVAGTPDDPNALAGRRVLVMGLGLLGGGAAAAKYAVEQGAAEVTVTDLRTEDVLAPSIENLAGLPIRSVLGRHDTADFERAEVVVRNPGVRRTSPYLAAARAAGARIEMEIAWFFRACRGKTIGITGTRGKGTTTMLLYDILTAAGRKPLLGGNMGIETLSLLPKITPETYVVLEIGVWMLEGLHTIRRSPHLAIFTNLLPDHLDAFDSLEEYGAAKTSIYRYQGPDDIALFNADNDYTCRYGREAPGGHIWYFSPSQRIAFERDDPSIRWPFRYEDVFKLRGPHHLANVQAATVAAELLGIDESIIRQTVAQLQPLPHRLEVVRTLDGVTYVNDSASTAPVAGIAALRSFSEPIVLIAGGNSKRLDCSEFAAETAARAKRVVILKGTASNEFASLVRAAAMRCSRPDPVLGPFDDLQLALRQARKVADPGDVVLLSPGFTSFGMFLNEFDRGNQFCRIVRRMRARRPQHRR
jgi:UDP-N-acetylmuramoylalanine--D-glutamate ligase